MPYNFDEVCCMDCGYIESEQGHDCLYSIDSALFLDMIDYLIVVACYCFAFDLCQIIVISNILIYLLVKF